MDDYVIERKARREQLWNRFLWLLLAAILACGAYGHFTKKGDPPPPPVVRGTVAQWYAGWDFRFWDHPVKSDTPWTGLLIPGVWRKDWSDDLYDCGQFGMSRDGYPMSWKTEGCLAHEHGMPREFQLRDVEGNPISVERFMKCQYDSDSDVFENEYYDNPYGCKNYLRGLDKSA